MTVILYNYILTSRAQKYIPFVHELVMILYLVVDVCYLENSTLNSVIVIHVCKLQYYFLLLLSNFFLLGETPRQWDPMPLDPITNKNASLHIVDLDSKSQEYQDVKAMFDKTMINTPTGSTQMKQAQAISKFVHHGHQYSKIVKIERIQNTILYSQYIARKKEMDKSNPQGRKNERQLFHGTHANTCSQINHGGFNRSYCGINGKIDYKVLE